MIPLGLQVCIYDLEISISIFFFQLCCVRASDSRQKSTDRVAVKKSSVMWRPMEQSHTDSEGLTSTGLQHVACNRFNGFILESCYGHFSSKTFVVIQRESLFDLKIMTRCWVMSLDERHRGAGPTGAERLGHQPGQAAGDLGPGEVVVVEAPDGRDDEGPSHPSVIRSISHLLPLSRDPVVREDTRARTHAQRGNGADLGIPPGCGSHPVQRNSMQ